MINKKLFLKSPNGKTKHPSEKYNQLSLNIARGEIVKNYKNSPNLQKRLYQHAFEVGRKMDEKVLERKIKGFVNAVENLTRQNNPKTDFLRHNLLYQRNGLLEALEFKNPKNAFLHEMQKKFKTDNFRII